MQPFSRFMAQNRGGPRAAPNVQTVESVDADHVSVCLITYNEEEFVEHCLERISPCFGHFAVLDMGSDDRTVTIIRDMIGPNLSLTEWPRRNLFTHGFAAARNTVTILADRPWAFHIDADELLTFDTQSGGIALKSGSSSRPAWKVGRRNLIGPPPPSFDSTTLAAWETSSLEQHVRLFRKQPGVEWIGFLHEEVFVEGQRATFSAPEAAASLDHISQFKSIASRGQKESFYAWMLMTAYFTPELRAAVQPEYIAYTESAWDRLYPLALDFGAREHLKCDWSPSGPLKSRGGEPAV